MSMKALQALALSTAICQPSFASPSPAKPDPALVARYQADPALLNAKLAECKKKSDFAAVLADVSCMSAEEVGRLSTQKSLASKCDGSQTFVYVPPDIKGPALEKYLNAHAPSAEALKTCNQTKEQWLRLYLKK